MSSITDIVVLGADDRCMEKFNQALAEHDTDRHQQLKPIDMDAAGGTKYFVGDVWAAALNHAPDLDEVVQAAWGEKRPATVMVRYEDDGIWDVLAQQGP